mmetsp:Transcript_35462/g.77624  ORF Transcript_35462/g.77624 Transcript_35462/m.77624 type:complete len:104 (-) Transcript_35462:318-629(-)
MRRTAVAVCRQPASTWRPPAEPALVPEDSPAQSVAAVLVQLPPASACSCAWGYPLTPYLALASPLAPEAEAWPLRAQALRRPRPSPPSRSLRPNEAQGPVEVL